MINSSSMCQQHRSSCGCTGACGYLGSSTHLNPSLCNPFPNFPYFNPAVLSTVPTLPNGLIISTIPPVVNRGCGC